MFASTRNGFRGRIVLALSAICMATLLACASTPMPAPTVEAPAVLSSVTVETDGEVTVVSLIGLEEPVYNAFKQEEPSRIVIDLASVSPGEVADAIAVYDGTIDEVTVEGFSTEGALSTRVEISLAAAGAYTVLDLGDRIEIRVDAQPSETAAAEVDPWATTEPAEVMTPDEDVWAATETTETTREIETGATETQEVVSAAPTTPATTLFGVTAESLGDSLTVRFEADGSIEGASWFGLDDPQRLVVDLPGLISEVTTPQLQVDGDRVARIRVGQHDGKVRVVLDGTEAGQGFDDVRIVAVAAGLWLGLGEAEAPTVQVAETSAEDSPVEVAEEVTAEEVIAESVEQDVEVSTSDAIESTEVWAEEESFDAAEEAAPATLAVFGVQLEIDEVRERVVIVTEGPAEFVTTHPSADTTVVSLKGATIDPEAAVRIAPTTPGSVSLVTAFQQPEAAEPEVRIVIRAQDGAKPVVTQEGALLFLDFETVTETASTIPMLSDVASAPAPGEALPASLDSGVAAVDILREGGLVDGKVYTGRRISLDFKDVEIDDVLRLIAEVSDLNIIAGDEVNGKVTIRLVDVPWDQALDVVLLTRGLGFVRVGSWHRGRR